ncbi:alpha/beta hydrolase family protein [Parvularcula lutaonensis]|uniref:Alpha/beta hydrolase family protein n=1 Tax=Parvularcula lutaonensis TaxID=491923 RepID=A0ABV7MB06_9PROT|nr:prolyl oligopeptidase family serine peptidase [Parvularcula lutaonensis]
MRMIAVVLALWSAALAAPTYEDVRGHWIGALVKDGAPLNVHVEITKAEDGTLAAKLTVPEWIWYEASPDEARLTETGLVIKNFYAGDAVLSFDPRYRQLVGKVASKEEAIRVHLKKALPPPAPPFTEETVAFRSADGTLLSGALVLPRGREPVPAMIQLHGRGCGVRNTGEARVFARYGTAVLAFDKRGAGGSAGACGPATHDDTVADAAAALEWLAGHPRIDASRIGLRGSSAGAWTAQALVEEAKAGRAAVKPAYIVTWVGPGTSIFQQQLSSAAEVAAAEGLPEHAGPLSQEAVRLAAAEGVDKEAAFNRLLEIRKQAEEEGWYGRMFGGDDLPKTIEDMDTLFLRKFRYDPASLFAELTDTPYLAVFGENDPVVPLAENVEALGAIEAAGGDLTVHVVPGRGHGVEHGDDTSTLLNGEPYFKHDTVEPEFMIATIEFLRDKGFLPR